MNQQFNILKIETSSDSGVGITSNERVSKQARNVFFFSKDKEEVCEWTVDHAGDLVSRMNKNNDEGMLWKNIPRTQE